MKHWLLICLLSALSFGAVVANARTLTCTGPDTILRFELGSSPSPQQFYQSLTVTTNAGGDLQATDFLFYDNGVIVPDDNVIKSHSYSFNIKSQDGVCVVDLPNSKLLNFTTHLVWCGPGNGQSSVGETLNCAAPDSGQ